ncbi:hypothetical protein B0T24DRAFT_647938 [Lasiosphaeria ovina]|uniref:Uncharacterized protein n=1 Tax=Lasiosphaeria ovina TaxID=92902 RepID=A0AAE0NAQ5_9PEZI|nr:hypothetical protein B0T24DRAFT_647938 [Lasiosphaeria ovina]
MPASEPIPDDPEQGEIYSLSVTHQLHCLSSSNFPARFWDGLSKAWLTPRALREPDRRTSVQPALELAAPTLYSTDLTRFVRHGSLDLRYLQGHLIEYNVCPEGYEYPGDRLTPEPENIGQAHLKRKNNTKSKGTIMRNVIPIITGNADVPNEGNLPFTNLESLTEGATVMPAPDFSDGAWLGDLDKVVREDLSRMIIPTKHADVPVAPNFFLEAKGPRGGAEITRRQACYDVAHGARAMYSLQSYGKEEPVYDGNAYTHSSTYHAGTGTLPLYAHHATEPTAPEGRPEHHMTQIDAYALTGSYETFI